MRATAFQLFKLAAVRPAGGLTPMPFANTLQPAGGAAAGGSAAAAQPQQAGGTSVVSGTDQVKAEIAEQQAAQQEQKAQEQQVAQQSERDQQMHQLALAEKQLDLQRKAAEPMPSAPSAVITPTLDRITRVRKRISGVSKRQVSNMLKAAYANYGIPSVGQQQQKALKDAAPEGMVSKGINATARSLVPGIAAAQQGLATPQSDADLLQGRVKRVFSPVKQKYVNQLQTDNPAALDAEIQAEVDSASGTLANNVQQWGQNLVGGMETPDAYRNRLARSNSEWDRLKSTTADGSLARWGGGALQWLKDQTGHAVAYGRNAVAGTLGNLAAIPGGLAAQALDGAKDWNEADAALQQHRLTRPDDAWWEAPDSSKYLKSLGRFGLMAPQVYLHRLTGPTGAAMYAAANGLIDGTVAGQANQMVNMDPKVTKPATVAAPAAAPEAVVTTPSAAQAGGTAQSIGRLSDTLRSLFAPQTQADQYADLPGVSYLMGGR